MFHKEKWLLLVSITMLLLSPAATAVEPALWAKAIVLATDDQDAARSQHDKAKSHYIKLRVEQFAK